ncbi:oxygen-independent coproporphyrinogen-3 oxidase [Methylohalomonas lacus]|uniref:Heme chaperone HemW n=1 Tax=Methylohalomonas lacus TaxID=398773 RepID=A0AAE3L4C3_9GAMM|nr:radical SAM family heme chaperone HemW [Methylohalomonas lacus]MCS3903638.1 oxygen-independent coproporphyrinogen-3 oxidase [Methylohalomonas lacus]
MAEFGQPLPLSLYVHIPWCVRKCPYCDFNSHELRGELPGGDYVDALLRDLDYTLDRRSQPPLQSIFIGGGTPSLLPADNMAQLLDGIAARLPLADDCEITLEANPGTVEAARFRDFRAAGINRLSLGVQSFADEQLRKLGRIHDAAEARRAIATAADAGFDNFNIDLMFGLPEQSVDAALADLEQAFACQPRHISWYQLTIEPNTVFYKQPPVLPDDENLWAMQCAGQRLLRQHGYDQYEVSAYARAGSQCRHNLNYWRFGDYLGIGAGAHAKLTDVDAGTIRRQARHRLPAAYLQKAGTAGVIADDRRLDTDDAVFEFMLNALRLERGVPVSLLRRHAGVTEADIAVALDNARRLGLLRRDRRRLQPTARGRRYLNDLVALFLPDNDAVAVHG